MVGPTATPDNTSDFHVISSDAKEKVLHITASMLSGRSISLDLKDRSSVAELHQNIAEGLSLESNSMQLFHDGSPSRSVALSESATNSGSLVMAGLVDGSHVEVGVRSWARPMQVPPRCDINLEARSRYKSS